MKNIFLFIFLFLFLPLNPTKAQEPIHLIAETGIDFISCAPPEKDYIRGNVEPLFYEFTSGALRGLYYRNYFGVKAEKRFIHDLIGISAGLRYTRSESSIGKNTYWSSPSEYFYFRLEQSGTTTEYLRIKELNQINGYIGVPLELRIYPYKPRFFNVYYKLGTDFNLLVSQKTDAVFFTPGMQKYTDEVADIIEDPWSVYASVHLAVGFKLGQPGKTAVMWEVCFPSAVLAPRNGFLKPQAGGGFQLNVRIPL
jgi:hypothetical protein